MAALNFNWLIIDLVAQWPWQNQSIEQERKKSHENIYLRNKKSKANSKLSKWADRDPKYLHIGLFFFAPCLSLEPDRFAYEKARCQNAAKRRPQRTCKSPVPPLLALRGSRCHDRWKSPSKEEEEENIPMISKRCPEEMAPTSWENISLTINIKTRDWICSCNHEQNPAFLVFAEWGWTWKLVGFVLVWQSLDHRV